MARLDRMAKPMAGEVWLCQEQGKPQWSMWVMTGPNRGRCVATNYASAHGFIHCGYLNVPMAPERWTRLAAEDEAFNPVRTPKMAAGGTCPECHLDTDALLLHMAHVHGWGVFHGHIADKQP